MASALEPYPLDADLTPSASGTGAEFKVVARRVPPPLNRGRAFMGTAGFGHSGFTQKSG
jgi:hypothetical protein